MNNYRIFVRCVGMIAVLVCGPSLYALNKSDDNKKFYEAIETADVKTVQQMLKVNPLLSEASHQGKPMLWGVLHKTALKNVVTHIALQNYAEIVGLLGKSSTRFTIGSNSGYKKPLLYSLLYCYPEIDRALLAFKKKPQGYTPQTKGKKEEIAKMVALSADGVVPFLKKNVGEVMDFFGKNPEVKKVFPVVGFESGISDGQGRLLSWKIDGWKHPNFARVFFSLTLCSQEKILCTANFNFLQSESGLDFNIGFLESPLEERQNGYGRLALSMIIKTASALYKKVYVSLAADPFDGNEKDKKRFLPRLVNFYKSQGFRSDGSSERSLFLWLVDGKVQTACESGALNAK